MKSLMLAAALALVSVPAIADAPAPFVAPTLDEQTYNNMMAFFRTTPMAYDISNPVITTLQTLEARAVAEKAAKDAKAAEAAKPAEPAKP